jgi:hypothetical protein
MQPMMKITAELRTRAQTGTSSVGWRLLRKREPNRALSRAKAQVRRDAVCDKGV